MTPQKDLEGPATRARSASTALALRGSARSDPNPGPSACDAPGADNDGDAHMHAASDNPATQFLGRSSGDPSPRDVMTVMQYLCGRADSTHTGQQEMRQGLAGMQAEFTGMKSAIEQIAQQVNKLDDRAGNTDRRVDDLQQRVETLERAPPAGQTNLLSWRVLADMSMIKWQQRWLQLALFGNDRSRFPVAEEAFEAVMRELQLSLAVTDVRFVGEGPRAPIYFTLTKDQDRRFLFAPSVRVHLRDLGLHVREQVNVVEEARRRDLYNHPVFRRLHQVELDKPNPARAIVWRLDVCILGRGSAREIWNLERVLGMEAGLPDAMPGADMEYAKRSRDRAGDHSGSTSNGPVMTPGRQTQNATTGRPGYGGGHMPRGTGIVMRADAPVQPDRPRPVNAGPYPPVGSGRVGDPRRPPVLSSALARQLDTRPHPSAPAPVPYTGHSQAAALPDQETLELALSAAAVGAPAPATGGPPGGAAAAAVPASAETAAVDMDTTTRD